MAEAGQHRARALRDGGAGRGDVLRADLEPRRLLVTAEALEVRRRAGDRVEHVEASDRARAAAAGGAVEADHDRGPAELLGEARGDDADHALVPALAGEHEHGVLGGIGAFPGGGARLDQHRGLDRLALLVELVRLHGQERALDVVGEQGSTARSALPGARCVQARADLEAHVLGRQPAREPGDVEQRVQAGLRVVSSAFSPKRARRGSRRRAARRRTSVIAT